jgi:isopropylmalate/homocitrate/citramalate synthase
VAALRRDAGLPAAGLEVHNHNDGGMVIANSVAAWLYGAGANVGTLLGIGEQSANPPIERLLFWRLALLGDTQGVDFNVIPEIEAYYLRELKALIPPNRLMGDQPLNLSPVSLAALYAAGERLREPPLPPGA